MDNKTFMEISKQNYIFDYSLQENISIIDVKTENGMITDLDLKFNDSEENNFIENIEENNRVSKENNKIYLSENLENSTFGQKFLSNIPIVIKIEKISEKEVKKYAFNMDGRLLLSVIDKVLDDGTIMRTWKDNCILIKDGEIVFREKNYEFRPVKLPPYNNNYKTTPLPESKIGSFDMEVFIQGSKSIVYALGFYSYIDSKPNMFYIDDKDLDSNNNVMECLNEMFKPKYKGVTWYCHNSGRYDSRILLKYLYDYNNSINLENDSILDIKTTFRDTTLLKLTISKTIAKTKYTITICDSYAILTDSLKNLAEKYEVSTLKGYFPHDFVNDKTLNYIGNTPDPEFYSGLDKNEYDLMYSSNWNLKEESLKYLSKDLISLYEIIFKTSHSLHSNFNVQMVNCLTVSRLATDIFLKRFNNNKTSKIPYVNNMTIFNDIHNSYYGGITEIYIPEGDNLYYYDVNSLYSYASYNDMPGLSCKFLDSFGKGMPLENSLFGFFFCEIKTPLDAYLGLLPLRTKDRVIYPLGSWEGWYFSEELKFASDNGYDIKILKGYQFNKVKDTFKSYVDTLSDMKANSKDITLRNLCKLLLNSLIGKLGMNPLQPITKVINKEKLGDILLTRKILLEVDITDKDTLVSYLPGPDKDITNEFNLELQDALNLVGGVDKQTFIKNISIPVASAVTSYARIYMSKVKLDILNKGGKIFYSDTDSIITDIELDK